MSDVKSIFDVSISDRFGLEVPTEADLNAFSNSFSDENLRCIFNILQRRSYRRFTDEEVSEELRTILVSCAQSASAKSDLQQYSIIDLRDQAKKDEMAKLCDTAWLSESPVLLVFCGDIRRAQRLCDMRGLSYAQNTLDSFMNAAVDAALAMQTMVLAAESVGLGCCCISQVRKQLADMASLLNLPNGVFPIAGFVAGWPNEERDVSQRLPSSIVLHQDEYDDCNLSSEVDKYDRRRHEVRPLRNQINTSKYGTASFYGWSENVARRLAENSDLDNLKNFLTARGFDLT